MGKRTSKVGITGLSRFVNIFTENQVDMRTGPTTFVSENPIKPVIQRTDDSCGDKNETVSKLVPSADRHKLGNGSARCDMTGLVPFYDAAAQVPEHLQKCTFCYPTHFPEMSSNFLSNQRFFPEITLFFTLR